MPISKTNIPNKLGVKLDSIIDGINAGTIGAAGAAGADGADGANGAGAPVAAPLAANSTGVAGSWAYDTGFIYVCTATDTWKRVALVTWP